MVNDEVHCLDGGFDKPASQQVARPRSGQKHQLYRAILIYPDFQGEQSNFVCAVIVTQATLQARHLKNMDVDYGAAYQSFVFLCACVGGS